jgi:hypothetical protein
MFGFFRFAFVRSQNAAPPPADVTFVGAATAADSGASVTVAAPAGAEVGDTLRAIVAANASFPPVLPSGWAPITTDGARAVYGRVHDGSANYTFNTDGAVVKSAAILAYRNVAGGAATAFVTPANDPTPPNLDVPEDGSRVLTVAASATAGNTYSMPAGWTLRASIGTNRTIYVFERNALADAGSLAGAQVTRASGSSTAAAMQLSLNG